MARKSRARSRHKARRGRSRQVVTGLFAAGAVVRSGWGRFVFGILIGLALGIGGVFYLGGLHLGNKGGAKVTTLNASPVQKATQEVAEAPARPKPLPQVVEPPHAKPLGEEAKVAAQTSKPPAPAPALIGGGVAQELGRLLRAAGAAFDRGRARRRRGRA